MQDPESKHLEKGLLIPCVQGVRRVCSSLSTLLTGADDIARIVTPLGWKVGDKA